MAQRSVERSLMGVLQRKPVITQPGRLIAHLQNEVGDVGSVCREGRLSSLEQALLKFERQGMIKLHRSGNVLNGVVLKHKYRTKS